MSNARLQAFGAKVRAMRKQKGLSQEELASLAGLDRSYMGHIERGEKNIMNRHRFARHLSAIQNGGRRTDNLLRLNVALYVVQAQLARISIETPKRHEKARTRRALACSERGGECKIHDQKHRFAVLGCK